MRPPRLSLHWLTHLRRPSSVVLADATTILLAAPAMSFKLTMGMSPFTSAPVRYPPCVSGVWCDFTTYRYM